MKIWLDDIRPVPAEYAGAGYVWVKDGKEAIDLIEKSNVECISLDHDLGDNSLTGYDVAKRIEELAFKGLIPSINWHIHSANPVGYSAMFVALSNANKYWE